MLAKELLGVIHLLHLFHASMVHFPKKDIWVHFLFVKTPNAGGGRGRFGKSPDFSAFFVVVKPSLIENNKNFRN